MENGWILAEAPPAEQNSTRGYQGRRYFFTKPADQQIQQADPNAVPTTGKRPPQSQWTQLIFIALIFVVLYFVMFRGPKKKQQQQQQMIKSLKKNDRVQTVGGILGTVLEVSDNEITLKVDESNNTKIKVLPSAISRVIEQK